MNFYEHYTRFLLKNKLLILIITVLITAFFAWHTKDVITLNILENMLPQDDPELINFEKLKKEYGGDFITMIGIEAPEIFTPKMLKQMDDMTKDFENIPHIENVLSLTNVKQIKGTEDTIEITRLIDRVPQDQNSLDQLKQSILSDTIYTNYLIHPKKPVTVIYIKLQHTENYKTMQKWRDTVIVNVKRILNKHKKSEPFTYYLAGRATIDYELDKSTQRNQIVTAVIIIIMIALVLFYLFRQLTGVFLCLGVIGLSSIWTTGFIGLLNLPLNFVTGLLPSLILIVAVLDCVHVYAMFRYQDPTLKSDQKIIQTIHMVFKPCLMTTLTTMLGFGCLMLSEMQAVFHFGLFAVFGIAVAFIITFGPFPVALSLLPAKAHIKRKQTAPLIEKIIQFFIYMSKFHWKKILVVATILVGIFIFGFKYIFIETRPVDFYPRNSNIPQAFYFLDDNFRGSTSSDMIIEGPPGTFTDPHILSIIEAMNKAVDTVQDISYPLSVVDYIKKANQALHENNPEFYRIPASKKMIQEIYFLLQADEDFNQLINEDFSKIRIHQRNKAVGSKIGKHVIGSSKSIANKYIKPPLTYIVTGANTVWVRMENYIVNSLIKSFMTSLVMISLLMIIFLRSLKWGLISIIPNLFPILGTFGLMGWLELPLNMITLMIASISIGIAVDDTIHIMTHIRNETKKGASTDAAIQHALKTAGPAVISTSLILACGFWAICFTDFLPNIHFGFLTGVAVMLALLGDLALLPAILKLFARQSSNTAVK